MVWGGGKVRKDKDGEIEDWIEVGRKQEDFRRVRIGKKVKIG